MSSIPAAAHLDSHRGPVNPWWYVLSGFLMLIMGTSALNILFNVLGPSLKAEFGWNRLQIATGLSISTILMGVSLFAIGFLVERFGIRKVATPMIMIFGVSIAGIGLVPGSLTTLYVLCAVSGLGAGAATATVYSMVVTAWFKGRRGVALGIVNIGFGLCGTLLPFVINALAKEAGWRGAFVAIGLACAVLPALNYAFFLRMPNDWEQERRAARLQGKLAGIPLREIVSTRHFWLICISIFLVSGGTYGVLSQIVSITTDRGIDRSIALSVLSAVSFSSIVSRFVVGYLLDRVFAPLLTAVIFVLCGAGVAGLSLTSSLPLLYLSAVLIGLGLGSEGDIAAYVVSRYVPRQNYGPVLGIVICLYAWGAALGALLLGYSFTKLGSYDSAIWVLVAMVAVAAVAMLFVGPYKYAVDGTPTAVEA
jgi:MFS family permease